MKQDGFIPPAEKEPVYSLKPLSQLKDELYGPVGSPGRNDYERLFFLTAIGFMISAARTKRNLTQAQLGALIGVQKARISKIENGANVSIDTLLKITNALNAEITLQIK